MAGKFTELKSVYFNGNNLPKTAGYIIAKLFCSRGRIEYFEFDGNCMGDVGVCAVAGAFSSSPSDLQSRLHPAPLSLPFSLVLPMGMSVQSKMCLIRIDLSGNGIGDMGVETLCGGLKKMMMNCVNAGQRLPLKSLILDRNRITDKGALAIAQLIDRGGLKSHTENHGNGPDSAHSDQFLSHTTTSNIFSKQFETQHSSTSETKNGANWGFWVEKNERNISNTKNNKSNNSAELGLNSVNSILLLEELGLGENMIGFDGVSTLLRAASCPLATLGTANSDFDQSKTRKLNQISPRSNNRQIQNSNSDFLRTGTTSSDNLISSGVNEIVFGTESSPYESVLLRKLDLGNLEFNLESLSLLTSYLSTFKIPRKSDRKNSNLNDGEYDCHSVVIDFSYNEKTGRELIRELAKLNNSSAKNTNNSKSHSNGSVFTDIVEKFVHVVRSNKNIRNVCLGELPRVLMETSIMLTENHSGALRGDGEEKNEMNESGNFEKNPISSPFFSLLLDINTALEVLDTVKVVLNTSPEISDWVFDHITQKRKRNEKKANRNSILEICEIENNIWSEGKSTSKLEINTNIDSIHTAKNEKMDMSSGGREGSSDVDYADTIDQLNSINRGHSDDKQSHLNTIGKTDHSIFVQTEVITKIDNDDANKERGRTVERKSVDKKNRENDISDRDSSRGRSRERVREYLECNTKKMDRDRKVVHITTSLRFSARDCTVPCYAILGQATSYRHIDAVLFHFLPHSFLSLHQNPLRINLPAYYV